jgi:hypothetical protein
MRAAQTADQPTTASAAAAAAARATCRSRPPPTPARPRAMQPASDTAESGISIRK